ncbi:hypothetical protein AERO9A_340026 [Aeromonas salmonicida]|nr:hypothetical protein AERO9A_340026 [Aeromonas salmonicida]
MIQADKPAGHRLFATSFDIDQRDKGGECLR